jgi:PAS domain S-box-containing protein
LFKISYFKPPVFEDKEKARITSLLYGVGWFTIWVFILFGLLGFFLVPENGLRSIYTGLFITFFCIITLYYNQRGNVFFASLLYISQLWVIFTYLSLTRGGIFALAVTGYLVVIMAAGLLMGWKAGFYTAVACLFTELGLAILITDNFIPAPTLRNSELHYARVHSTLGFLVIVFVYYYTKSINSLLNSYEVVELENKKAMHNLGERVKELTCLHTFSIILREENNLETVLKKLSDLLPPSFQYPEFTMARVRLGKIVKSTPGFTENHKLLQADFVTVDGNSGSIEVIYTNDSLKFLLEESELLNTLASMLRSEYDQRQTSISLKESEQQLRTLFSAMTDTVFVISNTGVFLQFAPTNYDFVFNSTNNESLVGKSVQEIMPSKIAKLNQDNILQVLKTKKTVNFEYCTEGSDNLIWLNITVSPFNEESVLWLARDISKTKQLEEQIRRVQRIESLGALAGGIAHDFNNVLAPLMLSIDTLKRKLTEPKIIQLVDSLKKSADRGKEVVRQILTFARGSGTIFSPLNLKTNIDEIETFFNETFPKNMTLEKEISDSSGLTLANYTQIHQILLNLLINARDAMPKGGKIKISLSNVELNEDEAKLNVSAKPGKYLLLSVSDTGEGISPENQKKLFEPFFTTKEIGKGTGLGLSTVYSIVQDHKGFIKVKSKVSQGSEFQVFLPTYQEQEAEQKTDYEQKKPGGNGELILVIDDEFSLLNFIDEILESYGYNVITASNGGEAMIFLASEVGEIVDLVMTNINMPNFGGIETIRKIRQNSPGTKIIVTTGSFDSEQRKEAMEMNIQGYMIKPFTSGQLLEILHKSLR